MTHDWFTVANAHEIPSPALLVYPERARENVRLMIRTAGGASRLRPHIKTHKMAELVRMQIHEGVSKFKCATIAEAELAASAGARDILIAYPIIGPNIERLLALMRQFPDTRFLSMADDCSAVRELAKAFAASNSTAELLLDLDVGQHRTGIEAGPKAMELYRLIAATPGIVPGGLHVYDGHITQPELTTRKSLCEAAFATADSFRRDLLAAKLPVPRVVAGGTPTFPIHAQRDGIECSPGTCVLWDFGYSSKYPELEFLHAALVLTRIISKPGPNRLCLDLGHKAIGSENPPPRVSFLNLPDARAVSHSEEHLVVESASAAEVNVGDALYGIPSHVCPTVALYMEANVIRDGRSAETWRVAARDRRITI
jgi:D-serine deaminase-like pyridoxal phosphate-dependent protein